MNGRGDILYAGIGTPPRPRGAWERGTGGEGMFKSKPGIQENKGLLAGASELSGKNIEHPVFAAEHDSFHR